MSIEFSFQPGTLDEILILDIRTRVDIVLRRMKDNHNISKIDIDILEMDKSTLAAFKTIRHNPGKSKIASNLINKIEYILKQNKED